MSSGKLITVQQISICHLSHEVVRMAMKLGTKQPIFCVVSFFISVHKFYLFCPLEAPFSWALSAPGDQCLPDLLIYEKMVCTEICRLALVERLTRLLHA